MLPAILCATWVQCPRRPGEGAGSPGSGVSDGCELCKTTRSPASGKPACLVGTVRQLLLAYASDLVLVSYGDEVCVSVGARV